MFFRGERMSTKKIQISPWHFKEQKRGKTIVYYKENKEGLTFNTEDEAYKHVYDFTRETISSKDVDRFFTANIIRQDNNFPRWNSHLNLSFNCDGSTWYCEILHRRSTYSGEIESYGTIGVGKTLTLCRLDVIANVLVLIHNNQDKDLEKIVNIFKDLRNLTNI
jgi:hypothetical protein